ncbi:glycosyltransferase family 4 protein [Halomonas dongshanensis]|uniref:Glycosyltransferase family 1 protein n=1 Tax=Halomonas dongshanensis TaxID=2890835 RepID=A0ABT2EFL5_9GAMM|nr:glycosyltransferase family 1 protein [Halomonas dongshanensis]MCS2610377.1 glycosyltransferase family 1 protein [Halomonas dongshanensis]
MRLCIVSETWSPEINGVAHTLSRLCAELSRQGTSIDLIRPRPRISAHDGQVEHELQVAHIAVPGYGEVQIGLSSPARLRRFWREHRPDVVYLATQGPLGWAARRAAQQLEIAVVAGWHTNFDHYCHDYGVAWLEPATRRYLRHFHNGCALTLVPTHAQAQALRLAGIHDVAVMSRGIDGERFTPQKRDPELRRRWGVGDHQTVALYAGRLAAEKNLTLLQETFDAMRHARPDMAQVIVGDGPLKAQLQKALPDAYFTGFIESDALARHYASADLFLFPSLSETWGNVVPEAMASGLAVVAFDHAASAELIDNGRNGVTLPPGHDAAFRDAAVALCQRPADYARLGRVARLKALEQSWAGIAELFLQHLHHARESYHASTSACRIRSS